MSITVYTDSTGQALSDQIKGGDGRPLDLTGYAVRFNMRYPGSEDKKIDTIAGTLVDATSGRVSYSWKPTDLDTPGVYYGWWSLKSGSVTISTDEFEVIIKEHSPGIKVRTGTIYQRARGIIPTTWHALAQWDDYGDNYLQERIEVIKLRVFGTSIPVENEATYDIRVQQYLAKLVVVSIIPTGVDYWMNQKITLSATGTNENVEFPDRIEALWKIHQRLLNEIEQDRAEIEEILDLPSNISITDVPEFSPGIDEGFKTPLPGEHFFDYAFPQRDGTLW